MDLLDRYVNAVRGFLPKEQQDDIVKEISANIRAEMDDREAELGRPLTEAEQDAILQQHGHPMIVASRYQTRQGSLVFGRQLIGSALFPFYLKTLRFIMGISFAIYLIVLVALVASGNSITFAGVTNVILLQVVFQFAVITAIFAVAEQYLPTMRWDARSLPTPRPVAREREVQLVPRLESVAQIVAIVVLLFWLRLVLDSPSLLFGPAADTYRLGPIWQQVALPTVLIFLASLVQAAINFFRPDWARLRRAVRVGTDVAGLGIIVYLLQAGHWVVLAGPNGAGADTLRTINDWVYYGLLSTAVGFVVVTLIDAWRLVRGDRPRAA
jgi:hypothetical protein